MGRKFNIWDKVVCTAGYYKHAVGKVVKIGNGHQPFYFIEWESRCKKGLYLGCSMEPRESSNTIW